MSHGRPYRPRGRPLLLPRAIERALHLPIPPTPGVATLEAARADLARMYADPRPLERPVLVLSGWHTPSMMVRNMRLNLAPMTTQGASHFVPVAYPAHTRFDAMRRLVLDAAERAFPSDDPEFTTEFDAVAVSMGGIVGRFAAAPPAPGTTARRAGSDAHGAPARRLRLRRLFTLASPHQGAWLADRIAIDRAAGDMIRGCEFLTRLDQAYRERVHDPRTNYEIIPYSRLRDEMVGATRAAPTGEDHTLRWVTGFRALSHLTIGQEPRFLADIARQLRGEEPLLKPNGRAPRD